MALFRRRSETYNEQLMREAGFAAGAETPPAAPAVPTPPLEPPATLGERLGLPSGKGVGPPEWDACVTVEAPGFEGDRIVFVTLPTGDVLVEEEEGDRDVSPFADAIEGELRPPYRATATRQTEDLWAVGAKRIRVARIAIDRGDSLSLARNDGDREVRVDGEPADESIPELERLGERVGADFYVEAARLDGDFWEFGVSAL
jgi:hypothetical protein